MRLLDKFAKTINMKKLVYTLIIITTLITTTLSAQNIYDFTVVDIDGNDFPLSQLEGKKVMIVNVASECGLTPQYEKLEELYQTYKDDNFVIIGFPANNFLKQEPGTNEEIKEFCSVNYGISFPMMSKISVKGEDMAPIYKWLTTKDLNGYKSTSVKWNFQKYIINTKGELVDYFYPMTKPDDEEIINWIEGK